MEILTGSLSTSPLMHNCFLPRTELVPSPASGDLRSTASTVPVGSLLLRLQFSVTGVLS